MDEYHFRLCIMLTRRLTDNNNDKIRNFNNERKYAMKLNEIVLIKLREKEKSNLLD
ncbi:hypothetical protein TUM4433_34090 [Shewanella schlegeliana]|nr:hypothetical protein TUM4433_34090 [Shewanella schlegeliana]